MTCPTKEVSSDNKTLESRLSGILDKLDNTSIAVGAFVAGRIGDLGSSLLCMQNPDIVENNEKVVRMVEAHGSVLGNAVYQAEYIAAVVPVALALNYIDKKLEITTKYEAIPARIGNHLLYIGAISGALVTISNTLAAFFY